MSDDADVEVGYCKPPKQHQFKKGRSGNPKGRPKKVTPAPRPTNDREIMSRLDAELVFVNGEYVSKRELELRIVQSLALKGDLRAMRLLDSKRTSLKLDQPPPRGGVLVVEKIPTEEEWKRRAYANQAKFREASYSPMPELKESLEPAKETVTLQPTPTPTSPKTEISAAELQRRMRGLLAPYDDDED